MRFHDTAPSYFSIVVNPVSLAVLKDTRSFTHFDREEPAIKSITRDETFHYDVHALQKHFLERSLDWLA